MDIDLMLRVGECMCVCLYVRQSVCLFLCMQAHVFVLCYMCMYKAACFVHMTLKLHDIYHISTHRA